VVVDITAWSNSQAAPALNFRMPAGSFAGKQLEMDWPPDWERWRLAGVFRDQAFPYPSPPGRALQDGH